MKSSNKSFIALATLVLFFTIVLLYQNCGRPPGETAAISNPSPNPGVTTITVTNNGATSYTIDGSTNPALTLQRGQTYAFNISAVGHPFYIKSVQGPTTANAYNSGVTNNGTSSGTLTFTVPSNAPNTLYYNCEFHAGMTGTITIP